jgi:hypothetical protein
MRFLIVLACTLLAASADAHAQVGARVDRTLGGFWIAVEYGLGYSVLDCPGCAPGEGWNGGWGYATGLALGGTPAANLDVGGEFTYFRSFPRSSRVTEISAAAAVVRFYPIAESPLSLRASAGYGTVDLSGAATGRISEPGPIFRLGAGYDVTLARAYALVPALHFSWIATSSDSDIRSPYLLNLSVGIARY